MLNSATLRKILPQSYPFLMIDRVEEFEKGKRLKAIKNITGNEWSTTSGAGDIAVFPETLIAEAASQAGLALYMLSFEEDKRKNFQLFLGKITGEFYNSAKVGDQINIEILVRKMLVEQGYMDAFISVDGEKIADVEVYYGTKKLK